MSPDGRPVRPDLDDLVAATAALLGSSTALVDDLSFSNRANVARLGVAGAETVIAKQPFTAEALSGELDALRLLPGDTRPALIASGQGVVVMEDLGPGPSLADLLLGEDRIAAEHALRAWAATLGRALSATVRHGAPASRLDLSSGADALVGLGADLGVRPPPGVRADVAVIEDALSEASPWLAYCPGDTCPDNNRVFGDGSVRLFDFEGSGWRHAATEAAYCRAPFCTCWCVAPLPAETRASMEAAFLAGLGLPPDDDFTALCGLGALSWTLTTFDHLPRFVLEGRPFGPPGRAPGDGRQYTVLRLEAFEAERDRMPALAELAGRVRDRIVERWPDAGRPAVYPAFRS